MFYCSLCHPKVNIALDYYTKNSNAPKPDDRLVAIEEKLSKLSDQLNSLLSSQTPPDVNDNVSATPSEPMQKLCLLV